jgi:hypothetical protein
MVLTAEEIAEHDRAWERAHVGRRSRINAIRALIDAGVAAAGTEAVDDAELGRIADFAAMTVRGFLDGLAQLPDGGR